MAQYKVMTQGFYIVPITVASLAVIEQYFTFHIARIAHKSNYIKYQTSCTRKAENILQKVVGPWRETKCYSKPVKKTWEAIMY